MRRVKCDETKPSCLKCTTTGRRCDGYAYGLQPAVAANPSTTGIIQPAVKITPPQVDATREEIELFHYFRVVISGQITGAFDETSWTDNLLQAIQQQPAIWSACIAASALHRVYIDMPTMKTTVASQRDSLYLMGLKQYHASLKHIISITQQEIVSLDEQLSILAANLLFLALSWYRGDMVEGFNHLCNGMMLIAQWRLLPLLLEADGSRQNSLLPAESLLLTYMRADNSTMPSRDADKSVLDTIVIPPAVSSKDFASPSDAYFELEFLWNAVLKITRKTSLSPKQADQGPTPDILYTFRPVSQRWGEKLMRFKNSNGHLETYMESIVALKVRHAFIEVLLSLDLNASELGWDAFDKSFSNIVELAETLAKRLEAYISRKQSRSSPASNIVRLAASMTDALGHVAWRCRNYKIRHRALDIIRRVQIKHYPTDNTVLAKISVALVMEEESIWAHPKTNGCGCVPRSSICLQHRIVYRRIQWTADGDFLLFLRTMDDISNNRPAGSVNVMQWTKAV